jgi:hypothetical protein
VKEHLKPTGLVLWAFLRWEDAVGFLSSVTLYSAEDIAGLEEAWKEAKGRLEDPSLSLTTSQAFTDFREATSLPSDLREYLDGVFMRTPKNRLAPEGHEIGIGYIAIDT